MTQPVGKARVHLSVERDGGGVNARQTWKDTLKSQQTAVRLHLDTEGKIAFVSFPPIQKVRSHFPSAAPADDERMRTSLSSVSSARRTTAKPTSAPALHQSPLFLLRLTPAMTMLATWRCYVCIFQSLPPPSK